MADLHVTTLCIAPAKAAGSVATQAADAGLPFDFSQLFADALVTGPVENTPQEDKNPGEEKKADNEEAPETVDPVQLLGLPVPQVPQVPGSAAPEVKSKPAEQMAASAPDNPKLQPKADKPFAREKEMPAEHTVAQPLLPVEPNNGKPVESALARPGDEMRMLAQAHASQPTQGVQAARAVVPVAAPVGTPQWREEFSAAVRVIATEQIQSAEIHLNPPELGPVQVSLRMDAREASIAFTAPHADTRQALEAALPRLRELLEAGGISLGSTSVDISGSGAFSRDPGRDPGSPQARFHAEAALPEAPVAATTVRSPRLLDVFA
jgi:flagellar hook-length control protein FliK